MDDVFIPAEYLPAPAAIKHFSSGEADINSVGTSRTRGTLYERSMWPTRWNKELAGYSKFDLIAGRPNGRSNGSKPVCANCPTKTGCVRITHEQFGLLYGPELALVLIRKSDLRCLIDTKPNAVRAAIRPRADPSTGTFPPSDHQLPPGKST